MSDLISRQVAIEAIQDAHHKTEVMSMFDNGILSGLAKAANIIRNLPSVEPEIITCKDCRYRREEPIADGRYWCDIHDTFMYYCSDAERRTDE